AVSSEALVERRARRFGEKVCTVRHEFRRRGRERRRLGSGRANEPDQDERQKEKRPASHKLERHLRRRLRSRFSLQIGLLLEAIAEEAREKDGGESVALRVERARRLVDAHSLDDNAVLRTVELGLQLAE